MSSNNRPKKLFGLFVFAVLLFNFPFIAIFAQETFFANIPLLFQYVFISWLIIILVLFIMAERKKVK